MKNLFSNILALGLLVLFVSCSGGGGGSTNSEVVDNGGGPVSPTNEQRPIVEECLNSAYKGRLQVALNNAKNIKGDDTGEFEVGMAIGQAMSKVFNPEEAKEIVTTSGDALYKLDVNEVKWCK